MMNDSVILISPYESVKIPIEDRYYTPAQVSKLVGITYRQIQYWDTSDFIKPSYLRNGKYRYYSAYDLCLLKVAKELRDDCFSIQELRSVIEILRREINEGDLKFYELTVLIRKDELIVTNGTFNFMTEDWIEIKLADLVE